MSIPQDDVIQKELIILLYSYTDFRLHVHNIYEELAKLHPELTKQEKFEKYRNSLSKWANRVQFARLHLVHKGLLYRDGEGPLPSRGGWVLTEVGNKYAQNHT